MRSNTSTCGEQFLHLGSHLFRSESGWSLVGGRRVTSPTHRDPRISGLVVAVDIVLLLDTNLPSTNEMIGKSNGSCPASSAMRYALMAEVAILAQRHCVARSSSLGIPSRVCTSTTDDGVESLVHQPLPVRSRSMRSYGQISSSRWRRRRLQSCRSRISSSVISRPMYSPVVLSQ